MMKMSRRGMMKGVACYLLEHQSFGGWGEEHSESEGWRFLLGEKVLAPMCRIGFSLLKKGFCCLIRKDKPQGKKRVRRLGRCEPKILLAKLGETSGTFLTVLSSVS